MAGRRLGALRGRLHLPRPTVRLRLTMLYGGLFLLSGAMLLALTNVVVRTSAKSVAAISVHPQIIGKAPGLGTTAPAPLVGATGPLLRDPPRQAEAVIRAAQAALRGTQHRLVEVLKVAAALPGNENHMLLVISAIGLGVMAVVSVWLGWIVAGRVLDPLRTITAAAREISATNLHRRLALSGPNDELRELGDTFDELLARLEASFEAQRQFVANASHELRTPLARQRTLAEVALEDPDATVQSLRRSHERLIAAGEEQERLIEALLTLARSERGLAEHQLFDLADLAETVLADRRADLRARRLRLEATLDPAPASGEPRLVERLIANLVDNAISYNARGGSVGVRTAAGAGFATLTVTNTGPIVPAGQVDRLLEPFQRLGGARTATARGSGLGLSIAAAIARAHGGTLTARSQPAGGLELVVRLPA
jgi:signal transduction histidine kinase